MIITNEFEKPLTAEDARKISNNNRDDSDDRYHFRYLMAAIRESASWGSTRWTTHPFCRSKMYSTTVQDALRSMGYRVIEKKSMKWDEKKKTWSEEMPQLDCDGRETFFLEITWG